MGYLSEFLLNPLDHEQGRACQILSKHPLRSHGLLPHDHGPLCLLLLLILEVLLLSGVFGFSVFVFLVTEVLKILLI